MLRAHSAIISLTLLSTLGSGSEAQVLERPARTAVTATPSVTLSPGARLRLLRVAGPTNLTATGTPAIARLRWDTVPGAIGYHVIRIDPAGARVPLTTDAITITSFEDQSGGVRPGTAYVYHVTATYPDEGAGTAEVSFTPPAAAVPAWVRVIPQGRDNALVWDSVPDAGSYQIIESWNQPVYRVVYKTVYSSNGTPSYVQSTELAGYEYKFQTHSVTAPQLTLVLGAGTSHHRFDVAAVYPPSGVTAPRSQWPFVVAP
jgi:hypothetical protein